MTVICFHDKKLEHHRNDLQADCEKFGLDFHSYTTDITDVIDANLHKPKIIVEAIKEFGKILYLDVECRIGKPLPDWSTPGIAYNSHWGINGGTHIWDTKDLHMAELWAKYSNRETVEHLYFLRHNHRRKHMHKKSKSSFYNIDRAGSQLDELAYDKMIEVLSIQPNQLLYNEEGDAIIPDAPIIRGRWDYIKKYQTSSTVIQHPYHGQTLDNSFSFYVDMFDCD